MLDLDDFRLRGGDGAYQGSIVPRWCFDGRAFGGFSASLALAAVVRHTLRPDRKSTRLNSSHANTSYAVFCLKKKTHTRAVLAGARIEAAPAALPRRPERSAARRAQHAREPRYPRIPPSDGRPRRSGWRDAAT